MEIVYENAHNSHLTEKTFTDSDYVILFNEKKMMMVITLDY